MRQPTTFPARPAEQTRTPVSIKRRQAIHRLQQRLRTVDDLIRCLEEYERLQRRKWSGCIDISTRRNIDGSDSNDSSLRETGLTVGP